MSKDTTISFRGSEELKEKVTALIENSGLSQKEWYEKAISITEMQTLKEGAKDYSKDLSELEMHTQRIYELIGNMVKRAGYEKDAVERQLEEVKASQGEVISDYQNKLKEEQEKRKEAEEDMLGALDTEEKIQKEMEQLIKANGNNEDLIQQYKEKIDTLSSLITEYKGYDSKNKELEKEMEKLRLNKNSAIKEMEDSLSDLTDQLEKVKYDLASKQKEHDAGLHLLIDKKDIEMEKALLKVNKQHQEEFAFQSEEYNKKVKELVMEIEKMRHSYDEKEQVLVRKYEDQINDLKSREEE